MSKSGPQNIALLNDYKMSLPFNESHALFGSIVVTSMYLLFRVLEAGLLGRLSVKYFELVGRTEEVRKLELASAAEKASVFIKPPTFKTVRKQAFEEQIEKVPMDKDTDEAILEGRLLKRIFS